MSELIKGINPTSRTAQPFLATPRARESWSLLAGASSTYGKIGTVPAAGSINVYLDCSSYAVERVDWVILSDKAFTAQTLRSTSHPLSATLTLSDATPVDDGDTFILAGLTFSCETTEGDASASARKWYHPSQEVGAQNLAALLQHATYGVPGITASAAPVAATDVITILPALTSPATCLQFAQGTSDANEIAFATTSLLNCYDKDGAVAKSANSTNYKGSTIEQYVDGWEYAVLKLTNTDVAAATVEVRAVRY